MVVNSQQTFNCLKCDSSPPDTLHVCLWLQAAQHFNLCMHCKSCCSLWCIIFLFFFFFCLASLPVGSYFSHSLWLGGLDLNTHPPQNRARGEHAITLWDRLHQGTVISSEMITWCQLGQSLICQSYQDTGFHFLWDYDLLGPWKPAASGGHLVITGIVYLRVK